MNLKEAFHYQNLFTSILRNLCREMDDRSSYMEETTVIEQSKVDPMLPDLTTVADRDDILKRYDLSSFDDLFAIANWIMDENMALLNAIKKAKESISYDLDGAIQLNKQRQSFADVFKRLSRCREDKHTYSRGGMGFRFNAEGNQVDFRCDKTVTVKPRFDVSLAKKHAQETASWSEQCSSNIDHYMVNTTVEYTPLFPANATLDDAIDAWKQYRVF